MLSTTERHNMETNIHCLQRVLRASRPWYHREYYSYPLHDAVFQALHHARPADWHQLVLEHAHVSKTDNTKIAYTRDDNAGSQDRQVTTTIGKYLSRHFPTLKDNVIRDISALFTASGIKIVHTTAEMLFHLSRGPKSCMQSNNFYKHPYEVYDPQYGWAMVVREENGDTIGRALVMIKDEDNKYFVRSYLKPKEPNGYSHSDNVMEAWLQQNGFAKQNNWGGEKLKVISHPDGGYVAPYLDGDIKRAELNGNYFCIDENGNYCMDDTGGRTAEEDEDMASCEDCGDDFPEDDGYWAGVYEDRHICSDCRDGYTYCYSRNGNEYLVPDDDTVRVDGDYYHTDYLEDNEIVELANGDHARLEKAVNINGDWYETDDDDICYAEDTEEYALKEDCWICARSDKWYTDGEEYVEINCEKFHPSVAPEQTEESNKE